MNRIAVLIVLNAVLAGCNYNVDKTGGLIVGATGDVTDLSFQNVYEKSISKSCMPCHAAPRNADGINLETYENAFAFRADVEDAVAARRMPDNKGRTMPEDARALLLAWVRAGAPRAAPIPGAVIPLQFLPLEITGASND